MAVTAFMKNSGLPGSPVVAVDPGALSVVYTAKGWVSDPGPATPPTFARPATATQQVKMAHALLPGRTITGVPYDAFYGLGGYQSLGWTLVP